MRTIRNFPLVIAAFMLMDVASTMYILERGGAELNPLALPFLEYGAAGLLLQKSLALCVVGMLIAGGWQYARRYGMARAAGIAYMAILGPLAAFPVLWNVWAVVA